MRKGILLCFAALAAVCCAAPSQQARKPQVRQPTVADSFYPGDAGELARMVDGFLAKAAPPKLTGPIFAIVSPHAGYEYSGPVAAYGYALIKGRKFDRVIVLAPSHVDPFNFSSIYDGDAYSTPLGRIPVDKAFVARLAATKAARLSGHGHGVVEGRGEHSIEVQLPLLQRAIGTFKLVPIVMGDQSYSACRALGVALAKLISAGPETTLIVASSDLSHYHPYNDAVRIDGNTLRAIQEWDYLSMSRNFEAQVWEACGGGPIITAMIASERLGANEAKLLKYANSGDTTGDKSRVVGYGSLALVKSSSTQSGAAQPFTLGEREKSELLALARKSVETVVREHKLMDLPASQSQALLQERGAFVTLKEKGRLRGCIGYVAASKPLAATVRDVAALAAVRDERFRPVAPSELGELEYEISVLSPLRRVLDLKQIQVGRDGLLMKNAEEEGLLLPQVPVEQHWNRATFLEQTCLKAGLPANAWQDPGTDVFAFTALVFGDHARR
jgi:AmmeMemoRadiSam system protein B/AmmeMemoRadiSam system protein A